MNEFVSKIFIAGVGFMGGSLARAVKTRKIAGAVIGVDSSSEHLTTALHGGMIDRAYEDLSEALRLELSADVFGEDASGVSAHDIPQPPSELLVICTPTGTVVDMIRQASDIVGNRPLLITDVGSTKRAIASQVRGTLSENVRYLGSHPISGSEKSGPCHADADIFVGRLTVLTPLEEESPAASGMSDVGFLEQFWNLLGSSVVQILPDRHDAILAKTSHLPHLLSVMLVQSLDVAEHYLVGPGFRDMSRLASGSPTVWTDIFASNKDAVAEAIDMLGRQLTMFRELLDDDRTEEMFQLLQTAKRRRDAMEKLMGSGY